MSSTFSIFIPLFALYLIYGFINGRANLRGEHMVVLRCIIWAVTWLPIIIIDLIVMRDQSHFSRGKWKWM